MIPLEIRSDAETHAQHLTTQGLERCFHLQSRELLRELVHLRSGPLIPNQTPEIPGLEIQDPINAQISVFQLPRDLWTQGSELTEGMLEIPQLTVQHLTHGEKTLREAHMSTLQSHLEQTPCDPACGLCDVMRVRHQSTRPETARGTADEGLEKDGSLPGWCFQCILESDRASAPLQAFQFRDLLITNLSQTIVKQRERMGWSIGSERRKKERVSWKRQELIRLTLMSSNSWELQMTWKMSASVMFGFSFSL